MTELLIIWGADRVSVDALALVRTQGREARVLRRDEFALVAAEDARGLGAINSHETAYCLVLEVK
ncbi:MAG: hypothetical protein KF823_00980 [Xanthomonadales bacterium]|nr:hypothetical protein [Xanthomonadales bacterium]